MWSVRPNRSKIKLVLGTKAKDYFIVPPYIVLKDKDLNAHKHIIGVSGVGKSKLLESIFLQLFRQDRGVSFIDPHGDSANAILSALYVEGALGSGSIDDRLLYIEFSDDDFFLPFNILNQPAIAPRTLCDNVVEAFYRAWPGMEQVGVHFTNILLSGCLVLIENHLPITMLHRFLTNKAFRAELLCRASDPDIREFFEDRFDKWHQSEAPQMVESTLNKVYLLTWSEVLKYSLGQFENRLNFRKIIDNAQSVIFNLSRIQSLQARRLLGCLITIGYETAAKSRVDIPQAWKRTPHDLLLDEFADYSAQSEKALTDMLSQTRKYNLFVTMAHQTWDQASDRLKGALQNVGLKVSLRLGRQDAEIFARNLGTVDPTITKEEDEESVEASKERLRTFMELPAQWEEWVATIQTLPKRHALVKLDPHPAVLIKTLTVQEYGLDPQTLDIIKERYFNGLMVVRKAVQLPHRQTDETSDPAVNQLLSPIDLIN